MSLCGTAIAPKSASKQAALLQLGDDSTLLLVVDEQQFSESVHEVTLSPSLGRIPRKVTFSNGWSFTADDTRAFNAWVDEHTQRSWIHSLESSGKTIIASVVVSIVLSYGFFIYGLPALAVVVADLIPVKASHYIGENTLELLSKSGFDSSEIPEQQQEKIRVQFQALLSQQFDSEITPTLLFKQWHGDANAFALADGTIILTDAMVELADTSAQLDAVLLHELGHVHHNHILQQLVKASMVSVLVAYIVGDASGVGDILLSTAALGISMRYSQQAETEADQYAANQLMLRDGSVSAIVELFEKLRANQLELPSWLSSHPDMDERIDGILVMGQRPSS